MFHATFPFLTILLAVASQAAPGADVVSIGSRRELFVDDALIERLSGSAELRLQRPAPQEIVIRHDAPWEGAGTGYHSLFRDGARFRMYYKAWQLDLAPNGRMRTTNPGFLCLAESDDGIAWRKPDLGLVEFNGSTQNNIVLRSGPIGGAEIDAAHVAVFRDENPAAPADSRYKAMAWIHRPNTGLRGLAGLKSADGLHWSLIGTGPLLTAGDFDSQNVAFWDGARGEYRAYWRSTHFSAGGEFPVSSRTIRTATSKDFLHWSEPSDLEYVDSPPEQLYTNAIKPYYRAPHLLIGFPARYLERGRENLLRDATIAPAPENSGWSDAMRALPDWEHRQLRAKGQVRYGAGLTEGLLMASRDGVLFKRWPEAFLRPGYERSGSWNYGNQFIGWHLLETPSAFAGMPPEISLYAVEGYWTGPGGSALRRYTLRLDGFVSVAAPMRGGELVTKPFHFTGGELVLNFATSAAGAVRVEIQDPNGRAISGFSLNECPPLYGDSVERKVSWVKGRATSGDVSSMRGRPVRLRFVLQDADLYAFQFR